MKNSDIATRSFKITCAIEKAFTADPVLDGGPNRMVIQGRASGTKLDRQGERMSAAAVAGMQKAIETGIIQEDGQYSLVPLVSNHRVHFDGIPEWDAGLGWLTKAWVDEQGDLWVEAELDADNPDAHMLFRKLTRDPVQGKPVRLGLSIGGRVVNADVEWDDMLQEYVPVYYQIALEETSVTSRPAYPTEYLTAIGKSVDWTRVQRRHQEEPMNEDEQKDAAAQELTQAIEKTATALDAQDVTVTQNVTVAKDADPTDVTEQIAEAVAKAAELSAEQPVVEKTEEGAEDAQSVAKMADEIKALKDQLDELMTIVKALPAQAATEAEGEPVEKSEAQATEGESVTKTDTPAAAAQPSSETVHKAEDATDVLMKAIKDAVTEVVAPVVKRVEELESQEVDGSLAVSKAIDGANPSLVEDNTPAIVYKTVNEGIVDPKERLRHGLEALFNQR